MVDVALAPSVRTDEDARKSGETPVGLWLKKIALAQSVEKKWREDAKKAVTLYEAGEDVKSAFNIHHSNVETIVPALYNTTPIPDVRRTFYDTDPVSRLGAEFIERIITASLDKFDFDAAMADTVQGGVLPGRGVPRIRYRGEHEPIIGHDGHPVVDASGTPVERVVRQKVWVEVVGYNRFVHGPGYIWDDVTWVAFPHDLTEDELIELGVPNERLESIGFGPADPKKDGDDGDKAPPAGVYKTVPVYEVWDKLTRHVHWITERDKRAPLKTIGDDPLGITGFFPVPKPFRQVQSAGKLLPVCPSKVYWPLLDELDDVTTRIKRLIKQLRVRGAVHPAIGEIVARLEMADDGEMVTADQAKTFQPGGDNKLQDLMAFWPLEPTVAALQQLYAQREQLKQSIFEVSGISDILRGATNPNETLGAQQIKAQWGNQRVQKLQKEVQRVARDLFRMIAEVHIKLFAWDELKRMTRMRFFDDKEPSTVGHNGGPALESEGEAVDYETQVFELLTGPELPFAIDIETDSTIRADMSRSQDQVNLFLQGTGQFIQAIASLQQAGLGDYVKPMTTVWATTFARQFQFGKEAEDALEAVVEKDVDQDMEGGQDHRSIIQQLQMQVQQLTQQLQDKSADRDHKERMARAQRDFDAPFREREIAVREAEIGIKGRKAVVDERGADVKEALAVSDIEGERLDRTIGVQERAEDRSIKRSGLTASATPNNWETS